jgi:phosphotransferase system enzyme I (PtsI)
MADPPAMRVLQGLGVSPGIAVGRAVCIETRAMEVYRFPLTEDEVPAEVERFQAAVRLAREEIQRIRDKVRGQLAEELGAIFEAHILFLADPSFVGGIVRRIEGDHVNAEWAVHRTAEELAEQFEAIEDEYLRERQEDLRDVAHQLLRSLQGLSHHDLSEIEGEMVVVADELTPSYALRLGRAGALGFAMASGGRTSHTAIIARSLHLPAIVGLPELGELVTDEVPLILDGESGSVVLHPTEEVLADYRQRQRQLARREEESLATSAMPATTADGVAVHLMANIDLPEEIADAVRFGATGIGLYRSEFLYIERSPELPGEEEHLALYRRLAEAAAPHPAIIRTYDLGGRKLAQELLRTREENPVLGLRGIRLTLALPHLFKTQLRALFRASLYGEVWVMVPMVSTLEEVRRFRAFCREVAEELAGEGLPVAREPRLGIMIEVPGAALLADRLAREVDFFSIGTNDLIQYALAVDRNNEHVASLYQPLHPGLLRMLRWVAVSAREAGIEVSVCGEMASEPRLAALLLGLGLRRLSMSPRSIPAIKTLLRDLAVADLTRLADGCLSLGTAEEVEARLAGFLADHRVVAAGAQEPR